ncbi:MAG: carbonic anhydrase [Dysgonomonas sp.]
MRIFFVVSVLSLLSYLPIYAQSTTTDPLTILQEGNKRFVQNELAHPNQSMSTVEALKGGQEPFAIIVSCSDSRVTPEIVFDRGLGDLFSIRTAGNVMSDYEEGSIEYAAQHLGTKLVVVMGHQGCGAVKAFLDYADHNDEAHESHAEIAGHVKSIIEKMNSEEEEIAVLSEDGEHYEKAVVANVINGVKQLRNSDPILAKMYKNGEINIVGAIYHIDNGQVEFLNY